jgi:hypothetical protein
MGTSKSFGSPKTLPWDVVKAAYCDSAQTPTRLAQLIWRAAHKDDSIIIHDLLAGGAVISCLEATKNARTNIEAVETASKYISERKQAGLLAELSKRAIVQSFSERDRVRNFISCLFREVTNYYVSRDISPLLGFSETVSDTTHIVKKKAIVIDEVYNIAQKAKIPKNISDNKTWSRVVENITEAILHG